MSATRQLAEFAVGLGYDDIPPEVTREAKRVILDSLACAIGAFESPSARICRELAHELGGPPEAGILGERERVGCSAAILANETMIRYLDYNDTLHVPKGPGNMATGHPSDALAALFAVAERVGASGQQVITAMVAGYEVMGRMLDAFTTGLEPRGFHHGAVMPYVAAAMAGKLLGLDADRLTHAMGIGGSLAVGLGILDAEGEEYNMTKNVADAFLSERGVLGVFLAQKGLTGPERVIEGHKGFAYCVLGARDGYRPQPPRERFWLMASRMKYFCAESTTQGHLYATATLVREHRIEADDIEEIRIRTSQRAVVHTGDPVKKHPRNKETADHSSYFTTAVAVLEGKVTPAAYTPARYEDPQVCRLIEKVHLEHGPEFDPIIPAASVTIRLKGGRSHSLRVDAPRGHPDNRMTDDEIRAKFLECARPVMTAAQVDRIVEGCLGLEREADIRNVGTLLVVP